MKMKRLFLAALTLLLAVSAWAQPAGYYNSTEGLTGDQLKLALHNITKGHTSITYAQLWTAFWSTDNKGNGIVWDMYSDKPDGIPPYTYQLGMDQCGNYSGEGDCYNREHSWPQSWFNNDGTARTDLHHIFPTDGFVNSKRSNYAFGEVGSASWTSKNGSKLGSCKTPGFNGTVFEPIDEYKGDFARAIMYMSVRYYQEDGSWSNSDMTTKSVIKPWAIDLLLRWNKFDPVSQKEIDRNDAIYEDYQHNRNPFVDDPEFADRIWDPNWSVTEENTNQLSLFPNPVDQGSVLNIQQMPAEVNRIEIRDLLGRLVFQQCVNQQVETISLPADLKPGCYLFQLAEGQQARAQMRLLIK